MNPRDPNIQMVEVVALADYLASRFREIVRHPDFDNTLPGLVAYDELYEDRIRRVRDRINSITSLSKK